MKNQQLVVLQMQHDAADYLVNKGVPFRDAHGIIGQLVLYAISQNKDLDELTLEEFKIFQMF